LGIDEIEADVESQGGGAGGGHRGTVTCVQILKHKHEIWFEKNSGNPIWKLILHITLLVMVFVYATDRKEQGTKYSFYLTKAVKEKLLEGGGFEDVRYGEDIWAFLEGPFADGMIQGCSNATSLACHAKLSDSLLVVDDFLFTQVMVKPTKAGQPGCVVPLALNANLRPLVKECFLDFEEDMVETRAWINTTGPVDGAVADCFKADETLRESTYHGFFHLSYGTEGTYTCSQSTLGPSFKQNIALLKKNGYLNKATRVFYIDFVLFSLSLQSYISVQLSFEHLPSGDVYPYYTTNVMGLLHPTEEGLEKRYSERIPVILAVCFQVYYLLVQWFSAGMVPCLKRFVTLRWPFKITADAMLIVPFAVVWYCEIYIDYLVKEAEPLFRDRTYTDAEKRNVFSKVATCEAIVCWSLSIICCMLTLKTFRYLRMSKSLSIIMLSLERAWTQSVFVLFSTLIVIVGYSFSFYLAFGSTISEFRTLKESLLTCVSSLFVEVDLRDEMWKANRVLGPLLLLTYMFFVSFIVLSLFLAVIEAGFEEASEDSKKEHGGGMGNDPIIMGLLHQLHRGQQTIAGVQTTMKNGVTGASVRHFARGLTNVKHATEAFQTQKKGLGRTGSDGGAAKATPEPPSPANKLSKN
jgi:hypothetical protein